MDKEKVVPDVIDVVHKSIVEVRYSNASVNLGTVLPPTQVKDHPTVHLDAKDGQLHVLCMTDPDAPSRKEHKFREWPHYGGLVIFLEQMLSGETFLASTGLHRYNIILVYEQPQMLSFDETQLITNLEMKGENFPFEISETFSRLNEYYVTFPNYTSS